LSGPFLAQPVLDIQLHDTYFVVGHFHLIMGVAAIFGMFAATYYWFPKMFGRMMNETWGRVHFFLTLAGTYAIFMPMHYLGVAGGTRRYSQYTEVAYLQKLMPIHLEHVQRAEGERQSVGSDDAGVDDSDASAARQLWGSDPGSESRTL
jgi:cytochrome c oxidase subunit 1